MGRGCPTIPPPATKIFRRASVCKCIYIHYISISLGFRPARVQKARRAGLAHFASQARRKRPAPWPGAAGRSSPAIHHAEKFLRAGLATSAQVIPGERRSHPSADPIRAPSLPAQKIFLRKNKSKQLTARACKYKVESSKHTNHEGNHDAFLRTLCPDDPFC